MVEESDWQRTDIVLFKAVPSSYTRTFLGKLEIVWPNMRSAPCGMDGALDEFDFAQVRVVLHGGGSKGEREREGDFCGPFRSFKSD